MRAFPHVSGSPGPSAPRSQGPPQAQPTPPSSSSHNRTSSFPVRHSSLSSDSSVSSQITSLATTPKPAYATHAAATESSSSIASTPRFQTDSPLRQPPVNMSPPNAFSRDRSRQHSQGFFEPSLPTASHRDPSVMNNPNLSASQIAAQAAMHVQNNARHDRRRSQTEMASSNLLSAGSRKPRNITPIQTQTANSSAPYASSASAVKTPHTAAPPKSAATTAASAAYPRSPLGSPFLFSNGSRPSSPALTERDDKPGKEKTSRRKLFLKPNKLHISKDKDGDKRATPKTAGLYGSVNTPAFNQSTTSLADPPTPATALYSSANASTSTLVPSERTMGIEKEKEKHRHHFLSRQKHKLKDDHAIALSSASSNSRPTDPSAPQSLYSFAPSSPSLTTKSISGLDLRHAGRAFREKKKEEKAAQFSNFALPMPHIPSAALESIARNNDSAGIDPSVLFGPASSTSQSSYKADLGIPSQGLSGFGLQNMSVDDAWPLLKARLLNVFEGEDLRTPIEDFNRLASAHLQRCVVRRTAGMMLEDVRDLFDTGFASLDMALRNVPDDRIVPHLVETWSFVFGTILPFMQAVFLPLDLEFKGRGSLLKDSGEAAEFWGAAAAGPTRPGTANTASESNAGKPAPKSALDIRTLVLHSFRSNVMLPRHDTLLAIFSRLSLDTIATPSFPSDLPTPPSLARPGTAASSSGSGGLAADPSSYNSQGSTLLDSSTTTGSLGARSRATSNTSAGSFASMPSRGRERAGTSNSLTTPAAAMPPSLALESGRITATVARMLQCVSVLAGLNMAGEDEDAELSARKKMERLAKELKLNWLGRSRVGRDRRGLVGTKIRGPITAGIGVGA